MGRMSSSPWPVRDLHFSESKQGSYTMSDFDAVPILDYNDLVNDRPKFIQELRNAVVNIGFLYWPNTPIPADLVASVKSYARRFFDLTEDQKLALEMFHSPCFLGYSRPGNEKTKGSPDNREGYDFGTELPAFWKEGDPECYK